MAQVALGHMRSTRQKQASFSPWSWGKGGRAAAERDAGSSPSVWGPQAGHFDMWAPACTRHECIREGSLLRPCYSLGTPPALVGWPILIISLAGLYIHSNDWTVHFWLCLWVFSGMTG